VTKTPAHHPQALRDCHEHSAKLVKSNRERFPDDFMFQLTLEEGKAVIPSRSQIATLKRGQNINRCSRQRGFHKMQEFTVLIFWEVETPANIEVILCPK
jgi:hypothetical protein